MRVVNSAIMVLDLLPLADAVARLARDSASLFVWRAYCLSKQSC